MIETRGKKTYLSGCLGLSSKIYLNTEAIRKKINIKLRVSYKQNNTITKFVSIFPTDLDITMKDMVSMQIIKCHQELNQPLTKLLHDSVLRIKHVTFAYGSHCTSLYMIVRNFNISSRK